ncbi:MAG: hypothetical protein HOW73_42965 [Polyangiaceae bacterium]|nr:hypothetical protein [Polyangiaceae bacterium]
MVATAITLLSPNAARAADPVTAEALFRAGRDAMDAGNYEQACERFTESQRLEPAGGTLLNLGECHEALGHLASAWQSYLGAAEALPEDPRGTYADRKRRELEPRLARVTIELDPSSPSGCDIARDGSVLGRGATKVPLPVDAGHHIFELRCPGRSVRTIAVTSVDGTSATVKLSPGDPVADATSPNEPASSGRPFLVSGLVIGGVGLIALAAGTATGVLAIDRKGIVDEVCSPGANGRLQCPPTGVDAASEGSTFATVSTATFIVGGVALATGVALVVVDVVQGSAADPAVRVGVAPTEDGAFVSLTGRF